MKMLKMIQQNKNIYYFEQRVNKGDGSLCYNYLQYIYGGFEGKKDEL